MDSTEIVSWAGQPKSNQPKFSELDSSEWMGKADAARLLGVHVRQLERRASLGQIAKHVLPKRPTEKAARVMYSRADIEAIKGGSPEVELDESERALVPMSKDDAYRHLRISSKTMAYLIQRGKLTPQTGGDGGEIFLTGDVEKVATHLAVVRGRKQERLRAEFATRIQAGVEERRALAAAEAEARQLQLIENLVAALLRAFPPPPPAPRPWLTLAEAESLSGLTRKWLLSEAESDQPSVTVRDMGKHARGGRWRFLRKSL